MKSIFRNRFFLSAVAALGLYVAFPMDAIAAPRCLADGQPLTAERRGSLWVGSIQEFMENHPNLSAEQAQLLWEASRLGRVLSTDRAVAQGRANRPVADFVRRAHELFSTSELGEIFAPMGRVQNWLVDASVLNTPYCNCSGTGACTFSGGPSGNCEAGCISWDPSSSIGGGEETQRYDGLCEAAAVE